jgi:hypothetical protein
VEDRVFVPSFPLNLMELRNRITTAVQGVNEAILQKISAEFDFRKDVSKISPGFHIEHL